MSRDLKDRSAPRLIVLDGSSGSRINTLMVGLVKKYLGSDAEMVSGGVTSTNARSALAGEYWNSLRRRARTALKQGKDVVLYGAIHDGPGEQFVERIAADCDARLIGLRFMRPEFLAKAKPSKWPNLLWEEGEMARDMSRKAVRKVDELAPPNFTPATELKGQALKLVLLDCDDVPARRAAARIMAEQIGDGARWIDMSDLREELHRESDHHFPNTPTGPELFEKESWNLLVERGIADLRQTGTLILSGRFAETDKLDVVRQIAHVTGAELAGYRIEHKAAGANLREEKTGLTSITWPSRNPKDAIPSLARSLAAEQRPPLLAELIRDIPDLDPGTSAPGLPKL
ncbi:MAG: hypothetical protein Alpg2KO_21250 [Alphaproteobacteria bacterium]